MAAAITQLESFHQEKLEHFWYRAWWEMLTVTFVYIIQLHYSVLRLILNIVLRNLKKSIICYLFKKTVFFLRKSTLHMLFANDEKILRVRIDRIVRVGKVELLVVSWSIK